MAQWILQANVPSITPAARNRTLYLAPLLTDVVVAVEAYFDAHPDGEEVTLAVLEALGRNRLDQMRGGRSFDRVKQDVGLLVAQTLVDLYGAGRVATLRRDDGKSVSARRNTRATLDWVDSFAPHRVLRLTRRSERILLDTSVVRKVIHGDGDALDPAVLAAAKGDHAVSIADGTFVELAAALLRGSVTPEKWVKRIAMFDDLLDPDFPVVPGGKKLAAFWGGHPPAGLDLNEARAYYRAVWAYLRNAKSAVDLSRREVFYVPSGRAYSIQLDQTHVEAVLAEVGQRWSGWVTNIATLIRGLRDNGESVTEENLRQVTKSHLMLDMGAADAGKLDLVSHVLAKRGIQAAAARTPYNPNGDPNDPLDLDLLFGIPLPAWVCTADARLHRLVRSTPCADRNAVMTVAELLETLAAEAKGSAA
jgi:hypothetical protein